MTLIDVLLIVTGIATGFLNVMAGGGSMLSVPVMIFIGIPGPVANGTNRIAILPQNLSAITAFFRKGFSDFKLSFTLALCAIPGAVLGAWFGTSLPGQSFNKLLALVMLAVMVLMWFGDKKKGAETKVVAISRKRLIAGHVLMVLAGFWGGFIQIGIGFILMPILHRVIGLDLLRTNMHKVFIVATYTIAALAVFAHQLELDWRAGIALAVGTTIGGWIAANFQIKRGVGAIRIVLNIVLVAFIVKLLWG